jgi:hypothetical protein
VSGIFLPLRVNSLPLATIYEVKIPLRKRKISLLQRNPTHMTWAIAMFLNTKVEQYGTHHSYVLVGHTLRVAENEILKLDLSAKRQLTAAARLGIAIGVHTTNK